MEKAVLCEVRGDWDWLNSWRNFPTWKTGSGMCWLCAARQQQLQVMRARCAGLDKTKFVERVLHMGSSCVLCGSGLS